MVVLATASMAGSAAAQEDTGAKRPDGVYLTIGGSFGAVNDVEATDDFRADLGAEIGFFVGVGYGVGPFRVEGQFLTDAFTLDNLIPGGTSALLPGEYTGSLNSVGLMANAFTEIGGSESVRPYLGIGGGFAYMTPDYYENICFIFCTSGDRAADGSDAVAAWQGMAGITVPSRRLGGEWDFGYRYFATNSADFRLSDGTPFTQKGVRSHSVQIGYRYYFGGPED